MWGRLYLCVWAVVALAANAALLIEDTPEERAKQVERVLSAQPISETLEDIVKELTKGKPAQDVEVYRQIIYDADTTPMTEAFRKGYMSTFTAEELFFLAEYSNSAIGKMVTKKMPQYVAKVTPTMQQFVQQAFSSQRIEATRKAMKAKRQEQREAENEL